MDAQIDIFNSTFVDKIRIVFFNVILISQHTIWIWNFYADQHKWNIKHEYLRSRASRCLSLSSSSSGDHYSNLTTIEILVLISWILDPGILHQTDID